MAGASQGDPNRATVELFDGLAPRYDRLGYLLSFGQDRCWRRALVARIAERPANRILDVATGPGGIAAALRAATGAFVVGVDLTWPMLVRARENLQRRGDRRVALVQASGDQLPFREGVFDAVSFSYLLRYVSDPDATVRELARPLRAGGTMASLEFHVPPRPWWRGLWWCYTRLVLPVAGRALGGREWEAVGHFLGPSISGHYRRQPVAATLAAWVAAGVPDVQARLMSVGGGVVMWGRRAAARRPPRGDRSEAA